MSFNPNKIQSGGGGNNKLNLNKEEINELFSGFNYNSAKKEKDAAALARAMENARKELSFREKTFNSVESEGDAELLEEDISFFLDRDDNGGDELLGDALINISHSHPYDDWCRHVDFVCTMQHEEDQGFRAIPFFIDATYNSDPDNIDKKFRWNHFAYPDFPGLGKVDYFPNNGLDLDKEGNPINGHRDGIFIAPRFVVGYDPNADWGEEPKGSDRRKYTVLKELTEQAEAMQAMYDKKFKDKRDMPKTIQKVYNDITILNRIFTDAMGEFKQYLGQQGQEMSEHHFGDYVGKPDQYRKDIEAITTGNNNSVYNAISMQTIIRYS